MKHPRSSLLVFIVAILFSTQGFAGVNTLNNDANTVDQHTVDQQCMLSQAKDYAIKLVADGGIGKSKAASIAQAKYGGKVVKVTRAGPVFKVKLVRDGRVRIVKVDANSGAIIGG